MMADTVRWSYGAGLVLRLGGIARLELNYVVPVKVQPSDRCVCVVICFLPQGSNSQTILGQSQDNFRTYDSLTTTGEFTEHLQRSFKTYLNTKSYNHLLDVLIDNWAQIHRLAYCFKIDPKICDKIISRDHIFCLKMIS